MTATETRWDPIAGSLAVETPDIRSIRKGIALPPLVMRILPLVAIASMGWTVVAAVLGTGVVLAIVVTTAAFGAFFLASHLENEEGRETLRRVRLARERGWSYTGEKMKTVLASDSRGIDAWSTARPAETARMRQVREAVPELVDLRVGAFTGSDFDGEFWGLSREDGLPFWVAIGTMAMDAALAADQGLRRDAYGGRGGFGVLISLLGAYRLDRKTGVRAIVQPENVFNLGPLDRDIKTESAAFNEAFRIAGRAAGDRPAETVELDVLRILTPATQATLLDLMERYRALGFVIDDDVLYFTAQDRLVGANARPDAVDRHICQVLEDFERAKFSLKRYVE
ncbi:hypothetical protein [Amorphus orientalis]|uniref:DUF3137 domain-containing protein n=1 Tax=Amorphus orientalis TaxID=649198 RepID=A0AAE3VM75_9HYPH|nr:hypothetical protein [Amorphus orientalis]MDQ0314689.1 hypothetical protein [Amorphus orientalis]